jgi:outer membrane protein OmpA-like peptidoglycan-associated protein
VAQDFSRIDGSVNLDSIALAPLQPLIARYATMDLVSGSASASATLAYRRSDGKMSLNASGPFQLDNVRLNEAGSDTLVLAWKRLSSREARLTLGPDRLGIKEIVVDAPEMRIDVSEQREVNLARLFKRQATPDGKVENQPAENQLAQQNEVQFPVHIGEVRLRDGTMDYSDRSLVLPFATHVTNLAGTAAGLGTDRDRRATLQFDGDIGEFGSLEINGRIDALSPTTFVDVGASFENVEMTELSPYTATFLGRKIASGKLWVEVKYRVENGELTGENDVTVHELALGEPVDTPTALKLPLDLAVALLTDSDGVIHAAIPVKGDLHDPKFAIGTVIREALGNLIKKIVSAPFRALAGLFGDKKEQDFGRIEFEPGSAKLKASEKEKLQNVAKAMEERPQLKLIVQAPYSPDADREAMKREKASRDVELALGRTLRPDENPGPVAFESLATQRALEKLSAKKSDPVAQRAWIAQYTKRRGTEPKRAGMILRSKGDPSFYEAMFEWLARTETVADAAMHDLAEERAQAVTETLSAAGIDAERLETAPAHPTKPEKEQKDRRGAFARAGRRASRVSLAQGQPRRDARSG